MNIAEYVNHEDLAWFKDFMESYERPGVPTSTWLDKYVSPKYPNVLENRDAIVRFFNMFNSMQTTKLADLEIATIEELKASMFRSFFKDEMKLEHAEQYFLEYIGMRR